MKLLITGSSGFLGRNLVESFRNTDIDVTSLDKEGSPNIKADLLKVTHLSSRHDVVLNLAAISNVYVPPDQEEFVINHNVQSFCSSARIAKASGAKLVIQASSSSVYGYGETPYSETIKCNPLGAYGKSKLACEKASRLLEEDTGVKIINLRLHNLIGLYQKKSMLPHLIFQAIDGKHELKLFGVTKRSWTPVEDLAYLIRAVCFSDYQSLSSIYNVGSESAVSQLELITIAETITGKQCPYTLVDKREFEMDITLPDMTQLKDDFGYCVPIRTDSSFLYHSMENVYRTYND